MDDKNAPTMKNRRRVTRVVLAEQGRAVLSSWRAQLRKKYQGIKVTDADLINWVLEKRSERLSEEEIVQIEHLFFDTVKQLEWLLREAKAGRPVPHPISGAPEDKSQLNQ